MTATARYIGKRNTSSRGQVDYGIDLNTAGVDLQRRDSQSIWRRGHISTRAAQCIDESAALSWIHQALSCAPHFRTIWIETEI